MQLFRLDASIRTQGSHSGRIADIVEQEWRTVHPEGEVVSRHLGVHPIASAVWASAVNGSHTPENERTPEQIDALRLVGELTDELLSADAFIFAAPLYNFGVSSQFKTWVDLVIVDPRMGSGPLAGRPAVLATARGGAYGTGTPREGWDHATPWMRRILGDVWQLDLHVVETEFTLVGVNPALDEFEGLAAEMREVAESMARQHGQAIAGVSSAA